MGGFFVVVAVQVLSTKCYVDSRQSDSRKIKIYRVDFRIVSFVSMYLRPQLP